ncbi:MAG TPA: GNAT family N-acetyltransferase [Acidimicrobiales bacterium]
MHGDEVTVERVPPAETYGLRQRVLRPGRPVESVHLSVDDDPATAAFVARGPDGAVVGTTIVFPEACPWAPDRPGAWRLRGMATEPALRGRGVGTRLLAAALEHVAREGGRLVWCKARRPAQRLYERAGFVTHGEGWTDPELGPHVAMWRPLRADRPRPADRSVPR